MMIELLCDLLIGTAVLLAAAGSAGIALGLAAAAAAAIAGVIERRAYPWRR